MTDIEKRAHDLAVIIIADATEHGSPLVKEAFINSAGFVESYIAVYEDVLKNLHQGLNS
jgi:hypothetical protein